FFFQAEDGIRDKLVTGVQTCALPISLATLNGVEPGAFAPRYHEVRGDAYYAKGDKANALKEYRSARTLDIGGVTDTSLLDLKISDLVADASPVPSPAKAPAK